MTHRFESPQIEQAYQQADHELRIWRLRTGCYLGLVLMPLGGVLDWYVYPTVLSELFISRIICDLLIVAVLIALHYELGRRYVRALTIFAAALPMLTMCWMAFATLGVHSSYYAGLNLLIVVICAVLPYKLNEAAIFCGIVLSAYCLACSLHYAGWRHDMTLRLESELRENWLVELFGRDDEVPPDLLRTALAELQDLQTDIAPALFRNLYFLVLTSLIGITACYANTKRRRSDFELRYKLKMQNEKLTELDQLKSDFFANVSHELRTPLTLILAPIEEMHRQRSQLPAGFGDNVTMMRQNGFRLLSLINDLLEIVRIQERKLKLRTRSLDINQLTGEVAESSRGLAKQKQLSLSTVLAEAPLLVQGDVAKLEKVLLNLLSNAIKFTPAGGQVTVRCRAEQSMAVIEVSDTGIGIAEDNLPKIFARFHQVGDSGRSQQGTGLGLAVAKELAEAHLGRLTVASRVGRGTTFYVRLPLDSSAPEPMSSPPGVVGDDIHETTGDAEADSDIMDDLFRAARFAAVTPTEVPSGPTASPEKAAQVLVVDDEADMRHFLVGALSREYQVAAAADGETALSVVQTQRPQVVLLDLMLPGMDGIQVCRELRRNMPSGDLKILMLTAQMDEGVKIEALESGADDFLTKPFSTVEVKTRIRNLLATAVLQQDLRQRNRELEEAMIRLKATEAQLIQSEKMNAIGSLASGLLHEINNPLNYMTMAVALAKRGVAKGDDKMAKRIADIEDGIKRIGEIIAGLQDFAYPETADFQRPFSLDQALSTALRFTSFDLKDVKLETPITRPEVQVMGSRVHVTQILVNLLTNAARAVEPVRKMREARVRLSTEPRNGRVLVKVWDNGVGMEPKVMERIFEPFFTTRDVGKGTGLGLSICHTLVRNHGGEILVNSQPGEWTEFAFDLPVAV